MGESLRYFVTATDTGVGKTRVAEALLAGMVNQGTRPFAFKPFESGVKPRGPSDTETLRVAAGGWQTPAQVSLYRFKAPLAPGMAAKLEGKQTSMEKAQEAFAKFDGSGVVEGAGGLFVPLDGRYDVVDLIEALALPLVVVARAGLGTLNHTALTLRELARREVEIAAVVLVQSQAGEDESIPLNRAELERRFPHVRFLGPVPYCAKPESRARAFEKVLAPLLEPRS